MKDYSLSSSSMDQVICGKKKIFPLPIDHEQCIIDLNETNLWKLGESPTLSGNCKSQTHKVLSNTFALSRHKGVM